MDHNAFTSWYNGIANKLISKVIIESDNCLTEEIDALWDTGATTTCISYEVSKVLKLSTMGKVNIISASNITIQNTDCVNILLPNGVKLHGLRVVDADIGKQGIGMLIGMDVISKGDFSISNYEGRTVFTFRYPPRKTIDFVDEVIMEKEKGLE